MKTTSKRRAGARSAAGSDPASPQPVTTLDMSPAAVAIRAAAALEGDDPDPPPFDANGFDPAEFEWRPVPRRPRADGWTPDVQRTFIEQLADTGLVSAACQAVDMSVQSAYPLRRARAWDAAVSAAADRLIDLAFQRAIEGEEVPCYDRDGVRIGVKVRYNDRLLMHLLRAYRPERFRHAHESVRRPGETPPPALPPVAQAVSALLPVPPAEPQRALPPERLAGLVEDARALAGYEANYPRDERERYHRPRVEGPHPAALERRTQRRRRERGRADCDDSVLD